MLWNTSLSWPLKLRKGVGKAINEAEGKDSASKESRVDQKGNPVKEKSDSKKEHRSQESNTKVPCENCGEVEVYRYYVLQYDRDGDPEISLMDCLKCSFHFAHFDKADNSEPGIDKSELNLFFALVAALLLTIFFVKESQREQFVTEPAPSNSGSAVQPSPRVLNEAEQPFRVSDGN